LLLIACSSSPEVLVHTQNSIYQFKVEVVDTPALRSKGLMYRKEMPLNHGMLFIWDKDTRGGFWMKNTYIPLDIIFIDKNYQIIHIAKNTKPLSEKLISPMKSYRYVLEINAGLSEKYKIKPGDQLHFKNLIAN
jgi:hypothetical protein